MAKSDLDSCACTQLRRASRVVTQVYDDALAPAGILGTQLPILIGLDEQGSVTLQALARELVLDRTTLSRNLRPLERDGRVRVEAGRDRRERVIALTAKGRRTLERALPLWKRAQGQVVRALGADRLHDLVGDLAELTEAVRPD